MSIEPCTPSKIYKKVVLGGTFDHFHAGHAALLSKALHICQQEVVIGLSDGDLLKNKKDKEWIQSFQDRVNGIQQFCQKIKPELLITIIPLHDPYGPSIEMEDLEAIVCSTETLTGAQSVNEKRKIKGLNTLDIIEVPLICPEGGDQGIYSKLSSSDIRAALARQANAPHGE